MSEAEKTKTRGVVRKLSIFLESSKWLRFSPFCNRELLFFYASAPPGPPHALGIGLRWVLQNAKRFFTDHFLITDYLYFSCPYLEDETGRFELVEEHVGDFTSDAGTV